MTACLFLLVGPPGSGKSTWARRNCHGAVHVSQDDLIDAITPGGFDHIYRPVYREAELRASHTVVMLTPPELCRQRNNWLTGLRRLSCEVSQSIGLDRILSTFLSTKEQTSHEYCHETR